MGNGVSKNTFWQRENEQQSAEYYKKELEKITEKAGTSSTEITYFYEDKDTNSLKNVIVNEMLKNDFTKYHKHDFYEMNYVKKGTLHEQIGSRSFTLKQGEMLIMAPKVYHSCIPEGDSVCFNLLFKKSFMEKLAENFARYDNGNFLSSLTQRNETYSIFSFDVANDEIKKLADKIFEMSIATVHHVDLYENLVMENAVIELLLTMTKYTRHEYIFSSDKIARDVSNTPDDIIRYINDNFDKINLADTAARFGYSTSQLHRIIERNTGKSFTELILAVRMQKARHYLLNTHLPIKNIAYLLGLDSAEHFSRMFRKNRGMSPKEYREVYMRQSIKSKAKR